jgi:hypothetical protein
MIRYIVIEYKGDHSLSRTEREVINYEYSDDLKHLRDKYNLPIITSEFSFRLESNGFSQYYKGDNKGILLFDIDNFNLLDNVFKRNIEPILIKAIRDIKINNLLY